MRQGEVQSKANRLHEGDYPSKGQAACGMSLVTRDRPARVSIRPVSFSLYGMQCGNNSLLIANDYNHQNEGDMEILDCNYFTCLNLCCFGRVASSPPWSWSETFQTNFGRVIDTDKTRRAPVKMVWKDVIREEKSLCPCNHTQREMLPCSIVERPCPLRRLPFVAIVGRAGDTFPTPRVVSVLLLHMIERSRSRPLF